MRLITQAFTRAFPYLLAVAPLAAAPGANAGTLGSFTSDAEGFDTRTYWYDDGQEVTVIDTQFVPALTEAMVAKIRASTASPITRVIVTHPNPDKFNGLSVLHALGAESIASARTAVAMPGVHAYKKYFWTQVAKSFTDADYPKLEAVKTTFRGRYTVRLKSGETLTLTELKNPAVSSTQTVVRIDRTGDLLVGDLVHHKAHLWLEGGIVDGQPRPDLKAWKAALAELPALGSGRVYGGRGESATVKEAVASGLAYLQRADDLVSAYARRAPVAELKDAALAQPHYAAIQKELEAAFPSYALGYLVGYGVYGLVNRKLAP
jgi:glyoxylase-like metal-dependent hydrolase (beta-lactamase superfamily II)